MSQVKRKPYAQDFKNDVVRRALGGEKVSEICEKEGIVNSLVYTWIKKHKNLGKKLKKEKIKEIKPSNSLREVVFYLEKAVKGMNEEIKSGAIRKEKEWHLLVKLALTRLVG